MIAPLPGLRSGVWNGTSLSIRARRGSDVLAPAAGLILQVRWPGGHLDGPADLIIAHDQGTLTSFWGLAPFSRLRPHTRVAEGECVGILCSEEGRASQLVWRLLDKGRHLVDPRTRWRRATWLQVGVTALVGGLAAWASHQPARSSRR